MEVILLPLLVHGQHTNLCVCVCVLYSSILSD